MTNNPQVPVVKHLLEQAERNAHLKENFTKSQNSKYISFINKIEKKIISAKDSSTMWQVKKKYNKIGEKEKTVKSCWVF